MIRMLIAAPASGSGKTTFTDFSPLERHPLLGVRYVSRVDALAMPDMVMLPGTKSTMADLLWMRENGLEAAVRKLASRGTPVLGVCGGYQMLGEELTDPSGVESGPAALRGMGLLPCKTAFAPEKTRTLVRARVLEGPLKEAALEGYEIHMGTTEVRGEPFCRLEDGREDGSCGENVFGTYLHGLFDSGELTEKLADWLCARKGIPVGQAEPVSWRQHKERQYNLLAEGLRAALDMAAIRRILEEEEQR